MVKRPMRIGIVGTHSTGKTLLMRRIEMELRAHGVPVARVGGLGKKAAALGLPKMERHTELSTEWIITTGIAAELTVAIDCDVVLADQAAPGALVYYTAALKHRQEKPDPAVIDRLSALVATQTPKYDLLLATVLDPTAPVNTGHDYEPAYRTLVDTEVHAYLTANALPHVPITNDDESRDRAVRAILNMVDALEAAA